MALTEHFEKLILGKNEEGYAFSDVHDYKTEDGSSIAKIFLTLEMPNNPIMAEDIAIAIFQSLKENFAKETDKDPYLRFEEVLKKINSLVLEKEKEKELKFVANLNVAIGVIARGNLYLSQAGEAEVYLIRGKYVSVISEGLSEDDSADELFSNIASGTLEHKDVVIFSSTKLLRYLTEIDLGKIFSNYDLVEALSELHSALKREVASKVALLAIDMKEVDSTAAEPENLRYDEFDSVLGPKKLELVKRFVFDIKEKLILFLSRAYQFSRKIDFTRAFLSFNKRKNAFLVLSVFLVSVLGFGVYRIRVNSNEEKLLRGYEAELLDVKSLVDNAQTRGNYDKQKAGELLAQAESEALAVLNSGYLKAEANQILEQIQVQKEALDNIRKVGESERRLVADFTEKRSNVSALGIVPYKDRLAVFEYNALYEIMLDRVADPLTIDPNESVIAGTYFEDQEALVFLTKAGKIIEYKDGTFSIMDTDDTAWHTGIDIGTYSDKLYILDTQNNQIWKYKRRRDRYDVPDRYLAEGDLAGAVSMAIDGGVYVLKSNGVIERYYVGKPETTQLSSGPIIPLENPRVIYTENEMEQIYVLDSAKSRILVYQKTVNSNTLTYMMQFTFSDIDELRDVYVDKKAQRMYVLTATKLWEVEL